MLGCKFVRCPLVRPTVPTLNRQLSSYARSTSKAELTSLKHLLRSCRKTHQVLVEVDVGPGDAGHAVEPEASDGHDVVQHYGAEGVDITQLTVTNPDDELDKHLALTARYYRLESSCLMQIGICVQHVLLKHICITS